MISAMKLTHAKSFTIYAIFMLMLFLPYLRGEVIAPTRLGSQFGIHGEVEQDRRFENPKFNDYSNVFLPEVDAFLNGPRSGKVALWTDRTEMGRPLYHVSGFSPVYLPARLLQIATHSPERFITTWSLSLVFFAGVFMLLFCQQLGLTPLASLTSAISYAASPVMLYWLAFPMFLSSWCWAAGCAWSLRRLADRADALSWVCVTFCVYSLLMTSYPQLAVYQIYIVGGCSVRLLFRPASSCRSIAWQFVLQAGSAGLVALLLAAPMFVDLLGSVMQSNRVRPDSSFFLAALPRLSSLHDAGREIVLTLMPNIFGVSTRPDYPASYDGLSLPILTISLVTIGVAARVRAGRLWLISIALTIAVATIRPIYLFGVANLGLGLSRTNPLSMLLMPCVLLQAYAIDALERDQIRSRYVPFSMALFMLSAIAGSVAFGISQGWPILWLQVAINVLIIVLVATAFWGSYRVAPLVLASACWLALVVAPTLLRQKLSYIHTQSPLIDAVRSRLHNGERFAIAAPGIAALPPNFNALLGLASVHSYDSLSTRRYQQFLHRLGGEASVYGRWNDHISPDYSGASFWMSDVALVLSPVKLMDPSLSCSTRIESVWLCDVPNHMGRTLQLADEPPQRATSEVNVEDPRTRQVLSSTIIRDDGDAIDIAVSRAAPSLLVISQQYHPSWHAKAFSGDSSKLTPTLLVNGFFQGVIVPAQTEKITLRFQPTVRYAYLANYVWMLLLIFLVLRVLLSWRFNSGDVT